MHVRMHVAQQTKKVSQPIFNASWLCALFLSFPFFLSFLPSFLSSWLFFANARLSGFGYVHGTDSWYLC